MKSVLELSIAEVIRYVNLHMIDVLIIVGVIFKSFVIRFFCKGF